MRRIILVLSALAACGGGDDAGSVAGTVHGTAISVGDSVSAAIALNGAQHGAAILLTSHANTCTDLMSNTEHPAEQGVIITVEDVMGATLTTPTVPGTYAIYQGGQAPPKAATLQVLIDDLNCQRVDNMGAKATSGTVKLTAISGNAFDGTFDVVLDSGDHITGSFHPMECPAIQNTIGNQGSGAAACLP